jgi:hypothetical protein
MANLEHRIADLEAASPPRRNPMVIFIEGVPARDGHPMPMGEIAGIRDLAKRQHPPRTAPSTSLRCALPIALTVLIYGA